MEFLDFIFIAILVIYIIRSIIRLVVPILFQKVVNKAQQGQQQNYQQSNRATGTIRVDHIPQGKKNAVPDNEGEFIDYEEIK